MVCREQIRRKFHKQEFDEMIKKIPYELMGQTEFAKAIGWRREKLSVYFRRGKLPVPIAMIGKRAAWTKEQVEKFKKEVFW